MRCRKVRSFLSTYSKKETSPEISARIESHLKGCSSCRREWEVFRSMDKLVKDLSPLKTSENFTAALFERIGQEGFKAKKTKAYLPGKIPIMGTARLATVASVAVILLMGVIGINFSTGLFAPSQPQFTVTVPEGGSGSGGDLYLTVQPMDNPLLNEHKSVSRMVQQYNRWREYSRSVRSNSGAEQFMGGMGNAVMASSQSPGGFPVGMDIRVRPIIKNYLIVPGNTGNNSRGSVY